MRNEKSQRYAGWLLIAGFALLIIGGKLWLLSIAGVSLPAWDQWDAIGEDVLRPWQEGRLRAGDLLIPVNEHRVVFTKLLSLGLCAANRQWDALVETLCNALLHTAFAVILLLMARRWLQGAWHVALGALLLLLFVLPFAWENTLYGFQSQFYFLLLLSCGHICLTLDERRGWGAWGLGQACGLSALLAMGSGFVSSAAVLAAVGLGLIHDRRLPVRAALSALVAVACVATGWLMRIDVPEHAAFRPGSVGEFLKALSHQLAWPGTAFFPWVLPLMLAPVVIFTGRMFLGRNRGQSDASLLGLAVWWMLQCVGIAHARGAIAIPPMPRYLDLLAVGVCLSWVFIARELPGRFRTGYAALWGLVVGAGLTLYAVHAWQANIIPLAELRPEREQHVRDFLHTGDPAHLLNKPWGHVPYPDGQELARRLSHESIQNLMPASVRRPVAIAQDLGAPRADAPRTFSSRASPDGKAQGLNWRGARQSDSALPVLRFSIAGDLGAPGKKLSLTVRSDSGTVPVLPARPPGEKWESVSIIRPDGPWWVEAVDDDPDAWFAFSEPVEMGRLSFMTGRLLQRHRLVLAGAALLMLAGAVMSWIGLKAQRRAPL